MGPFTFGYPLLLALPVAVAVVAVGAIVLDVAIYRRLRDRGVSPVVLAMASLGVAIALRGLVQIIWSGETQRYPREFREVIRLPMDVRVPPDGIFIAIVTIILVVGVYLVLTRTKMGKAMRATADNPELALVSGINTQRVVRWTWGMGAVLAATAGVLLAVFQAQLLPVMGWKFLIPLFARRDPWGYRQSLRCAGGRLRHRGDLRGLDPVDQSQLQAGGGFRHHDRGAAGAATRHIRSIGMRLEIMKRRAAWT